MSRHRRMSDPAFRRDQWNRRFDSHVALINHLVDDLRREAGSCMPYVAPLYGGTASRVLFVFAGSWLRNRRIDSRKRLPLLRER